MVRKGMMQSTHFAKVLALWTSKDLGWVQDGMTHAGEKAMLLECACDGMGGLGGLGGI